MDRKPSYVNVPVVINIWVRPDCQRRQFEVIKVARPSHLLIVSDGGRNEKEWAAINESRKMYDEEVDWDCQVDKCYQTENQGMYGMVPIINDFVWSRVDRMIYLEDDILPSVSFFRFASEMLEKYKDDQRILAICGMNHLGAYDRPTADYFFSRKASIWGLAYWRRSYDSFNMNYKDDPYAMDLLHRRLKKQKRVIKQLDGYARGEAVNGHPAAEEFYFEKDIYSQNQLYIIPKNNMIANIGCTAEGTHSVPLNQMAPAIRRLFEMKTYDIYSEIKHPVVVMPDDYYEKQFDYIMGFNHPVIDRARQLQGRIIRFTHGGAGDMLKKVFAKKSVEK